MATACLCRTWVRMNIVRNMVAGVLLFGCGSAQGGVYFVSTNGHDANSGTSTSQAFRTLQRATDAMGAGDSLMIAPGSYREFLRLTHGGASTGLFEIAGMGGVRPDIKGSEAVTNWAHCTNFIWMASDWPLNAQQVFEDGAPLRQVGWPNVFLRDYEPSTYTPSTDTLTGMTSGSFFYDMTNRILYVWCSDGQAPTAHVVEVAVRSQMLYADDTVSCLAITNVRFGHGNTFSHSRNGYSGVRAGARAFLKDCVVEWCDGEGLSVGGESEVRDCDVSRNGMVGLGFGTNSLIHFCTISSNNYRRFNMYHHAGGMKVIPAACQYGKGAAGGTVEDNEIAWNYGFGVWFDYCTGGYARVVRNNYIHHNQGAGVMMEVTRGGVICNNLIVSNNGGGIHLSATDRIRVFNNTLIANSGWVDLYLYGIPRAICDNQGTSEWATAISNEIVNNVIFDSRCSFDAGLMGESTLSNQYVQGNICDYNCYYRPADYIRLSLAGVAWWSTLAGWTNGTIWDSHSLSQDPAFTNSPWGMVTPCPTSPLIDRGFAVAGATTDYHHTARPLDGDANGVPVTDMGAIEFVHPAADSDSDGLRDTNEMAIGTSPVLRDTDLDQQSDYEEVLAGTDPVDGASLFELSWLNAGVPGQFILRWPSADGRYYDLARTFSLTAGFFSLQESIPAVPPENIYTDAVSGVDRAFYQITVRR